jgi:hypothetical protein
MVRATSPPCWVAAAAGGRSTLTWKRCAPLLTSPAAQNSFNIPRNTTTHATTTLPHSRHHHPLPHSRHHHHRCHFSARQDVPALLRFVLHETKAPQAHFLGHSMGGERRGGAGQGLLINDAGVRGGFACRSKHSPDKTVAAALPHYSKPTFHTHLSTNNVQA